MKQTVQILYSTSDTDINHFNILKTVEISGGEWQKIEAELPEGTKFFAIRNVTKPSTAYILLIDDISYYVGGGNVEKYNIYRDGILIGSTTDYNYIDVNVTKGNHIYQVTASYINNIESAPTTIEVIPTGISTVSNSSITYDIYTLSGVC